MTNCKTLLSMVALGLVGTTLSVATAEKTTVESSAPSTTMFTHEELSTMGAGFDAARPFTINITGATLMEAFIAAPQSTNDFIDCDFDTRVVPLQLDNLAAVQPANPYDTNLWWNIQYRVVGSVNGFQELVDFGRICVTTQDIGDQTGATVVQNTPPTGLSSDVCQLAYINSGQFIVNGQSGGVNSARYNRGNPGAVPTRTFCDPMMAPPVNKTVYSSSDYTLNPTPAQGGFRADIAPLDVPTSWAVTTGMTSDANFDDIPGEAGYGRNPRLNRNKNGTVNSFGFQLVNLPAGTRLFNGTFTPDADTVFDTDFAYTPVAFYTNFGVGRQTITYTTLRHLYTTGRTDCGENLVANTRDTGSGTHNAAMNSICIDPSQGVGEAIGGLSTSSAEQRAGAAYIPGNKGGSSGIEATSRNSRLGIGYAGAERGVSAGWLTGGRLEALGVLDDLRGGAVAARPTIENVLGFQTIDFTPPYAHVVLANRFDGFNIGGPGVLATFGDPRSNLNDDRFGNNVAGVDLANSNPALRNPQAAAYINNITRSTEAFIGLGPNPTLFSPAELLAQTLIINGSRAFTQNRNNPCNLVRFNEVGGVPVVDALVDEIGTLNRLADPVYDAFGQFAIINPTLTINGFTPEREDVVAPNRYSDSSTDDYRRVDGTVAADNSNVLRNRNRIAGDFNGDFMRDWNDAGEMMEAYLDRQNRGPNAGDPSTTPWDGGGATVAGPAGDAIIEVLGDFNSDGNFGRRWNTTTSAFVADTADIRYWADGLALDPATKKLNRCEGFRRVDAAWLALVPGDNNFFDTVLATPKVYAAGDSVGDVAGSGVQTPNFAPIGHDGVINAADIDYVFAQFRRNPNVTDGALNWSNLAEAQYAENSRGEIVGNLSCDINGDLIIDQQDIVKLVTVILGTDLCDVNLDGVKNAADEAIIVANLGNNNSGWATGDVNGDGVTNQADRDQCFPQVPVCCVGNADKVSPGNVAFSDITAILNNFNQPANPNGTSVGDANCDGFVNFADVTAVLNNFTNPCN